MFWHFFALATLGKPAVALAIIASAYGAGSALVSSDYRTPNPSAHETGAADDGIARGAPQRVRRPLQAWRDEHKGRLRSRDRSQRTLHGGLRRQVPVAPHSANEEQCSETHGDPEADDRAKARYVRPEGQGMPREIRSPQDTEDGRPQDVRSRAQHLQADLHDRARDEGLNAAPPRVRSLRSRLQLRARRAAWRRERTRGRDLDGRVLDGRGGDPATRVDSARR